MSFRGIVKNGVIVPPPDVTLKEGASVEIDTGTSDDSDNAFLELIGRIAKPRPHWPDDFIVNHGFYTAGEPKRE